MAKKFPCLIGLVFWFSKQRQYLHFLVMLRPHMSIGPWYWTQVLSLCCQVFYRPNWSCRTELNLCHLITHTEMNKYCVCILELCIFCRIFGSYNLSLSYLCLTYLYLCRSNTILKSLGKMKYKSIFSLFFPLNCKHPTVLLLHVIGDFWVLITIDAF